MEEFRDRGSDDNGMEDKGGGGRRRQGKTVNEERKVRKERRTRGDKG